MQSNPQDHSQQGDGIGVIFAELGDADSAEASGHGPRRRFFWAILAVVLGVVAVLIPGVVTRLGEAVAAVVDPTSRVAADLGMIPGVAVVGDAESRAGDLTFRSNVFFTVLGDDNLSRQEQDALIDAISARLAGAQGHTRFMVELDLGTLSVGISPVAALNPARIALARSLADVAGVARATVLWRTDDDDLIFDEDNRGLDVWVQSRDGSANTLIDNTLPLLAGTDQASLTAVVLGANSPREHVYSWSDGGGAERGEREVTTQADDASAPEHRAVSDQLDAAPGVSGYRLGLYGATIAFVEGVDVRQTLASVSIPAEWQSLETWTSAEVEYWTREQLGALQ